MICYALALKDIVLKDTPSDMPLWYTASHMACTKALASRRPNMGVHLRISSYVASCKLQSNGVKDPQTDG